MKLNGVDIGHVLTEDFGSLLGRGNLNSHL